MDIRELYGKYDDTYMEDVSKSERICTKFRTYYLAYKATIVTKFHEDRVINTLSVILSRKSNDTYIWDFIYIGNRDHLWIKQRLYANCH